MKNYILITTKVAIIACVVLTDSSFSNAVEYSSHFSLGYGSLTQAPADPKAPEPGGVTAKFDFVIAKDFKPYIGTGLAYSFQPEAKPGDTKRIRSGVAGQAGFSYLLGSNSSLNIDYKYFNAAPDATQSPPQSLGVGLEIKF